MFLFIAVHLLIAEIYEIKSEINNPNFKMKNPAASCRYQHANKRTIWSLRGP